MKKIQIAAIALMGVANHAFGQGEVIFAGGATATTRIYTNLVINGWSTLPTNGSGAISGPGGAYMFALFSAPSTVNDVYSLPWMDPRWQFTGQYGTNVSAAGRFAAATPNPDGAVAIPGYPAGEAVSLLVVGWSTAAGGTNLSALINAWNVGAFANYGYSDVAHVLLGDGALLNNNFIFGSNAGQISGFVLGIIPEPTAVALTVLGGGLMLVLRRRKTEAAIEVAHS